MKKFAVLVFVMVLGAPLVVIAQSITSTAQDETVVEEIIARINNNIITRADMRRSQRTIAV